MIKFDLIGGGGGYSVRMGEDNLSGTSMKAMSMIERENVVDLA